MEPLVSSCAGISTFRRIFGDKKTEYGYLCMWSAARKVVKLKSQYETEHGFAYDLVMLARFDVVFFQPVPLTDLDPARLWVPDMCATKGMTIHNPRKCGQTKPADFDNHKIKNDRGMLLDWYWISSSNNIDKLSMLGEENQWGILGAHSSHHGWPIWANQQHLLGLISFGPHLWNVDFTLARHVHCFSRRTQVEFDIRRRRNCNPMVCTLCLNDRQEICPSPGTNMSGLGPTIWSKCSRSPANFESIGE